MGIETNRRGLTFKAREEHTGGEDADGNYHSGPSYFHFYVYIGPPRALELVREGSHWYKQGPWVQDCEEVLAELSREIRAGRPAYEQRKAERAAQYAKETAAQRAAEEQVEQDRLRRLYEAGKSDAR